MGILLHNLCRLEGLRENQADGCQLHRQDRRLKNNYYVFLVNHSEAGIVIYIQRKFTHFFEGRNEPLLCHTRAVMMRRQLRYGLRGTRRHDAPSASARLQWDAPSASIWPQGDALS